MTLTTYQDYQELFNGCVMYLDGTSLSQEIIGSHTITNYEVVLTGTNRFGIANTALTFTDKRQYLSFGNVADLKPTTAISIIAWVKPSSEGGGTIISCVHATDTTQGHYYFHAGGLSMNLLLRTYSGTTTGSYANQSAQNVIDADTWQMVAGTVLIGGNINIYKNAVNVNYNDSDGGSAQISNSTANVKIGTYDESIYAGFIGNIGEIMFFNRELTAAEIKAIYNISSKKYLYPLLPDGKRGVY